MLSIGLLLLCMMAACNNKKQVPEPEVAEPSRSIEGPALDLSTIDSLMWQRPDSALALLLPWFDTCCRDAARHVSTMTEYNRHYANLLLAELLYKNDYEQINRTELLQAVGYYDSLLLADTRGMSLRPIFRKDASHASANTPQTIAFLDARAHYINGVGYYENDSVVQACEEYLKALEIMEEQFEEKELTGKKAKFMALTYTRLSMLFSDMYLHDQSIYFAQLSLVSNKKTIVPNWHIARMLCEIGMQYEIMEQLDSSDYYYSNAIKVLKDTCCVLYRDISTRQTYLSYKKEGVKENTMIRLYLLLNQANSETECLSRCLTMGEVFYQENLFDSAWLYLNKVYNNTSSIASKKQAAEWLLEICKIKGGNVEILEYSNFLVPFANKEENQSETKSQLTELYNVYRQSILSRHHQQEIKKNTIKALLVIIGLAVGLLAYVFLYHSNRKRKQLLEKQIREEQFAHNMKQKALSGRLKHSNQKLQETLKRIEDKEASFKEVENVIVYESFVKKYKAFRQSQICLDIMDKVNDLHDDKRNTLKTNADIIEYKAFAMTLSQIAQLTKTVDMFFPNLYMTLKAQYAAINRKDWLHCCLYMLQLDKMSICVLLQEPYYTCRRCVLRLENIFNCRQGLAAFLLEQAKDC